MERTVWPEDGRQAAPGHPYLTPHIPSAPHHFPSVKCPRLDCRAWSSWADVGIAMGKCPQVPFRQGWRPEPEPEFQPGTAALAHFNNQLIIYAELFDLDIFNSAREDGCHAYLHGDVFEIFLRAAGEESYFEHHITPSNHVLQFCFPSLEAYRGISRGTCPDWETRFAGSLPVPSQVLVQPELKLWRILALAPLASITSSKNGHVPESWKFSFCRYDYTRSSKKLILSSTSAYTRDNNYHEMEAWGSLFLP
jgi:hypothetical protein